MQTSTVIKTLPSNDPVQIHISVDFKGLWDYMYKHQEVFYTGNYNENLPHTHELLTNDSLNKNYDQWSVRLLNLNDDTANYQLSIKWIQNHKIIQEWVEKGSIPHNQINTLSANAVFQ